MPNVNRIAVNPSSRGFMHQRQNARASCRTNGFPGRRLFSLAADTPPSPSNGRSLSCQPHLFFSPPLSLPRRPFRVLRFSFFSAGVPIELFGSLTTYFCFFIFLSLHPPPSPSVISPTTVIMGAHSAIWQGKGRVFAVADLGLCRLLWSV